jgi:hypothetical protein
MRIRTIKPDFWGHPVMSKQSESARLLALGLLNLADDEGYFYADPKLVRNAIRPMDDDSRITTVALRELSEIGYICVKTHPTHGEVGYIVNFLAHQVINKPKSSIIKALYNYGSDTVAIPDDYGLERKGKEGNGMEWIPPTPKGGEGADTPKPKPSRRLSAADKKRIRVKSNTPIMIRIGAWFGRQESTLWTIAEAEALESTNPSPAEIDGMEGYYSAKDIGTTDYRRKDLLTLLNNWPGELDRARGYYKERGQM